MRAHRLPPVDTTGYVSCPINTPIVDFDDKSPLPCIIVTPDDPTQYHIAFHPKDSPLKQVSFAAQQQKMRQQQKERQYHQPARSRRAFFYGSEPPSPSPLGLPQAFDIDVAAPQRRFFMKPRIRTALILSIPIFIVACHLLATTLLRSIGHGSPFFGGRFSRSGLSSVPAHLRTQRDPQPEPVPEPLPKPAPVPVADAVAPSASAIQDSGPALPIADLD